MEIKWQRAEPAAALIGDTRVMRDLRALIDRVATTDSSVLVTGPSGSGKEVVARRLHERGRRAGEAFVAINCAAIPRDLLEAELFGHEPGAFTGAVRGCPGRFETANGGTLLLDEVGELPPALQAKLLRVLETRMISRVGGRRDIPIDVRIVAATNADLAAAIDSGRFREDLYYRLAVIEIEAPSLAARRDDVPELVAYLAARLPGEPVRFAPDALARLRVLPWRGNVRELRNVVERAAALYPGRTVGAADIDALLSGRRPPGLAAPAADPAAGAGDAGRAIDMKALLTGIERDLILDSLRRHGGEVTGAARMLGLNRTTLREKLRRHGIERHAAADGQAASAGTLAAARVATMKPAPSTREPA